MNDFTHARDKLIKYLVDDPISQVHDYGIDLNANHIYLVGSEDYILPESRGEEPGVEYAMANRFIKNLNILMRRSDEPILIHMKTNGGDWHEGMAIYNAIKACPNEICILNYTHARSMSSLIFLAADRKVMMPDSSFMFHEGTMGFSGTCKQYINEAEELKKTNERMLDIYVDAMREKGCYKKRSRKFIRKWLEDQMKLKEEVYLSAEESVRHGFADEVFGIDGIYDWTKLLNFSETE